MRSMRSGASSFSFMPESTRRSIALRAMVRLFAQVPRFRLVRASVAFAAGERVAGAADAAGQEPGQEAPGAVARVECVPHGGAALAQLLLARLGVLPRCL
jgi:hypothetical protein